MCVVSSCLETLYTKLKKTDRQDKVERDRQTRQRPEADKTRQIAYEL